MMTQDIEALEKESFLSQSYGKLREAFLGRDPDRTIPSPEALVSGSRSLPSGADHDWAAGRGAEKTIDHILTDIVPALNNQVGNSRYYGLVTGGLLPVAEAADNIVTALDQNVQIKLPGDSLAFAVENAALAMIVSLLQLGTLNDWPGRTFSTGATGSNILGLMCGRDALIARRLPNGSPNTITQVGIVAACAAAGVQRIQVLTSMGHFSTYKAASIVGLGHASVVELPLSTEEPWRLDIDAVEHELARPGTACIIAVSAGEVNTGRFATEAKDMVRLRALADQYKAWIHIDGGMSISNIITEHRAEIHCSIWHICTLTPTSTGVLQTPPSCRRPGAR
jgi:glutamate/tyrosine decarboxylase-like PLP-dependent enzyme